MDEYIRVAATGVGSDTIHLLIANVTASSDGPLTLDDIPVAIEVRSEACS